MKKALKINLSGQIFHIDEDAYEKLKTYLDTIGSHFSDTQESKEIISDIENRIAELFTSRMKEGSQVISIKDVNEIIEIMGKPEEIASDEEEGESKSQRRRSHRRLYRDPENAAIGGVCSGLGAYFNVDTLLIRILFIVLVLVGWGLPILLYLILWIAVPKAKTAAEKLEMKGEKVTVSNIEKTIREEYDSVKENFKKARGSESYKRAEGFLSEFVRVIGLIILAFMKIILVAIAVSFIIAGIAIITGLIGFFFMGMNVFDLNIHDNISLDFFSSFVNPANVSMIAFCVMLLILIPVMAIIYGLFKVLFRFRAKDRALGLSAFVIWFIALISALALIITEAQNFNKSESISYQTPITNITSHSILISTDSSREFPNAKRKNFTIDDTRYDFINDGHILGRPKLDLRRSTDGEYRITIMKDARGKTEDSAIEAAESISYSYTVNANTLILSPHFSIPEGGKWRFQQLRAVVFIPEGDTVVLDKNLRNHLDDVKNTAKYSSRLAAGNRWVMGKEGLELIGAID